MATYIMLQMSAYDAGYSIGRFLKVGWPFIALLVTFLVVYVMIRKRGKNNRKQS